MACRILVPQVGIKPGSMEVKARVLTTRISCLNYFKSLYNIPLCVCMIISLFILSKIDIYGVSNLSRRFLEKKLLGQKSRLNF